MVKCVGFGSAIHYIFFLFILSSTKVLYTTTNSFIKALSFLWNKEKLTGSKTYNRNLFWELLDKNFPSDLHTSIEIEVSEAISETITDADKFKYETSFLTIW